MGTWNCRPREVLSFLVLIENICASSGDTGTLMLCILGNYSCFCCRLLTFFKIKFSKNSSRNTIRVSNCLIQIRTNIVSVLIWVQIVCKCFQKITKVLGTVDFILERLIKDDPIISWPPSVFMTSSYAQS